MCTPMGKIRTWAAVLAVLTSISAAYAQGVPIGALPNAATPLSGSELTVLSQNGQTVKATVNQVVAPGITIPNNTVLGNVSGLAAAATSLTASQIDSLLGLGTAAFNSIGTSGGTVPLLNAANTWSALQTFSGGISLSSITIGSLTVTTTFASNGTSAFTGAVAMSPASGLVAIGPTSTGTINNMTIGATTRAAISGTTGNFNSTLLATGHVTFEGVTSTGATGTGNLMFSIAPTITGHPTIEGVTSTGATGTGNFVFSIAPTITGHPTVEGVTSTGATGTGNFVFSGSPSLTTPALGVATASSLAINGATIGTNALAVTGTANISGTATIGSGSTDAVTAAGGATGGTISTTAGSITVASGGGINTTLSDSAVNLSSAGYHSCGLLTTNSAGLIGCSANAIYPAWAGVKTTAFNAVSGNAYCVDTLTTGAVTMTLPPSPADGDQIRFIDCKSNFAVTAFTVGRNGHTIMGLAADMTVSTANAAATLIYVSTYTDWRMY